LKIQLGPPSSNWVSARHVGIFQLKYVLERVVIWVVGSESVVSLGWKKEKEKADVEERRSDSLI
jgi:hypothetical protein